MISLLWSTCNTAIGKENSGDKSKLITSLNKTRSSPTKSKASSQKKSDSLKVGKHLAKRYQIWLLSSTWLKVWEATTWKTDIGNNLKTKQKLTLITRPQLSHLMTFWSLYFTSLRQKSKKSLILPKKNLRLTKNSKSLNKTGPSKFSCSIITRKTTFLPH